MKSKIAVWAYLIVLSLGTMLSLYMPKTEAAQKESIVIPGEAIRLRILANSDFEADQAIKRKVRDAVNAQITLWVQDLTSIEKARTVIKAKLPEIQAIAEKVVHEHASEQAVKVEFGKVQFPTKLYGQYLYPAGEYQAILITLGSGEGANWWCVLYPPLCFLDFSNGVAVSNGFDEKQKAVAKVPKKVEKDLGSVEQAAVNHDPEKVVGDEPREEPTKEPVAKRPREEPTKEPVAKRPQEEPTKELVTKRPQEEPTKEPVAKRPQEERTKEPTVKKPLKEPLKTTKEPAKEPEKKPAAIDKERGTEIQAEKFEVQDKKSEIEKETTQEKAEKKHTKKQKQAPVYTAADEESVKVKFFVVEMWEKLFN